MDVWILEFATEMKLSPFQMIILFGEEIPRSGQTKDMMTVAVAVNTNIGQA